ncbi:MAG TPA: methyltransferase, partial [Thermoplasmata archaeon]|nr:methyltransferase [Thermoplasmata archaeon]
ASRPIAMTGARAKLIRTLDALERLPDPDPGSEQVATPAELAVELLADAAARDDLAGRSVLDLGSGGGTLAIAAAQLGAAHVLGIERDPRAVELARKNAAAVAVDVEFRCADVGQIDERFDTVVMNPPFGAQRKGADRPFWIAALRCARRRIYGFALTESRTFIARFLVDSGGEIEATRPVRWRFPATFAFHTRRQVELAVDLWVLRPAHDERKPTESVRDARGAARHRRGVRARPRHVRG